MKKRYSAVSMILLSIIMSLAMIWPSTGSSQTLSTQAEAALAGIYKSGPAPRVRFPPLSSDPTCTSTTDGLFWYNTTSDAAKICVGGTATSVGSISGSGTTNTLVKWTSSTALGNSLLTSDGTNTTLTSGKLTGTGQTVTTSKPLLDLTQTWNASGVTFTALKSNVTSTASAADSLFLDLQLGGTSQWNVNKVGVVTQLGRILGPIGTVAAPAYSFNTFAGNGISTGASELNISLGGVSGVAILASGLRLSNVGSVAWRDGLADTGAADILLFRDAAAILAQRNGTNAQTSRVYGTFTDTSNYERLSLSHVTGTGSLIAAQTAGTGGDNLGITLTPAGTGNVTISSGVLVTPRIIAPAALDTDVTVQTGDAVLMIGNNASVSAAIAVAGYGAHVTGSGITVLKTRSASATADANTIVQDGDRILSFLGLGADGASYQQWGNFRLVVDGTPGVGSMPARFEFHTTPSGSGTAVERWRITSVGHFLAGANNTQDIGATAATSARSIYASTSFKTNAGAAFAVASNAIINTAPTIASGFGTTPSVVASNGTAAFTINVGTGGTASSGVITLPTATTGWSCNAQDQTTPGVNITKQTANSTTSSTLTNYNSTTGIEAAWTASDILYVNCTGF